MTWSAPPHPVRAKHAQEKNVVIPRMSILVHASDTRCINRTPKQITIEPLFMNLQYEVHIDMTWVCGQQVLHYY